MKKLTVTALVFIAAVVGLFLVWFIPFNLMPLFLREAEISVWRAPDCTSDCIESFDSQVITKYPELQNALQQIDKKFTELSKTCSITNDTCTQQLIGESIRFEMRGDIAAQMSEDLENAGANKGSVCFEGGCHSLRFNVENAAYTVGFNFR